MDYLREVRTQMIARECSRWLEELVPRTRWPETVRLAGHANQTGHQGTTQWRGPTPMLLTQSGMPVDTFVARLPRLAKMDDPDIGGEWRPEWHDEDLEQGCWTYKYNSEI